MTEKQDIRVVHKLKTDQWVAVGSDGDWSVYETDSGILFATHENGERVSFEVYSEWGGVFEVY